MKNVKLPFQDWKQYAFTYLLLTTLLFAFTSSGNSQCVTQSNTIEGFVFQDNNHNGIKDPGEGGIANVRVQAFDDTGSLLGSVLSDIQGNYAITNLTNGKQVRLTYLHNAYHDGFVGTDNGTRVQFVTVPACSKGLGLSSSLQYCNEGTRILTTCFVQGLLATLPNEPTIVGLEYGFNLGSAPSKFAMYSETGTVWGVAWNKREKALYSSAFIKQYGGLTQHGHDAIFKTSIPEVGMSSTSLFVKLSDLGQNVGALTTTDINNCNYGAQVGRIGLGALEISPDQNYLYTVNLFNNTLVAIPTENPSADNTKSYQIPDPGCSNGEYRAFALKMHNNKLYVGVTCTGETAQTEDASSANVYEFDPQSNTFTLIFTTNYIKGYWRDNQANQIFTMHWLTDIDFTDDGNMLIALSDRTGHRYCTVNFTNRLDDQRPDLLVVGYNKTNKTWSLENNGKVNNLTGSGVGNSQGPGGGEFFGMDHWMKDPSYHPEVALGSIFVMPGTNSVVSTVYDPHLNAYSGGLHRYSTTNGELLGVKELYTQNTTVAFGKATGFGDIVGTCIEPPIEIGNRVWHDVNKNGVQDAGEAGFPDINLVLYNDKCEVVGNTTTDDLGNYSFNASNVPTGLQSGVTYYIGLDPALYDNNTSLFSLGGNYYSLTFLREGEELIGNKAIENTIGCSKAQISVQTSFANQNYDLGLYIATGCGMKINAVLVNTEPVRVGDIITYEICVTNTGALPVNGWVLENTMPSGNVLDGSLNPGWTNTDHVNTRAFKEVLGKGKSNCSQIHIRFDQNEWNIGFAQNFAITQIIDINDQPVDDILSCATSTDDLLTSQIPNVFDLALKHELDQDNVYSFGSEILVNTTVYNQGNIAAGSYTVVNYLNEEFDFDPSKNIGWELSQDGRLLSYQVTETLHPGENKTLQLLVVLKVDAQVGSIINYAEISNAKDESGQDVVDFDSTPDDDVKNDIGGEANTMTDNMINDHGLIDEDDHDPLVVLLSVVDVAIKKTVQNREILPGQEVVFNLEILNQGSVTIKKLVLRDYIPSGLLLQDENWTLLPNNVAEREIFLDSPLFPGESTFTQITLFVDESLSGPLVLTNVVQVYKIFGTNLNEISSLDIDSNLSLTVENEEDSVMAYIGQDNFSSAAVVMLGDIIVDFPCLCLGNATDADNGQFLINISFVSASGESWHIEQLVGLFDEVSPSPPVAPIPFITGPGGFILDEFPLGGGLSEYTLTGIHIDGQGLFVIVQNEYGITRSYRLDQGSCQYNDMAITGPTSVCNTALSVYSVPFIPNFVFDWTIDGIPVGSGQNFINVDWSLYADGNHVITVSNDNIDFCFAPATLNVVSGIGEALSISCIANINVSLDENCRFVVTPAVMIAGQFSPGTPYQVILMDQHGNIIPNATLTIEHLGQNIMAKLIDGCGGNSCWGTIFVEDKIPPVTFCQDIILACHELDAYVGPFETDNCGEPVINTLLSESITTLTCDEDFIKYIDRIYSATDASGNVSVPCSMRIYVARPDVSLVVMPDNLTMANGNPLICDNFPVDDQGRPSTEVTGVPTLHGVPLYPAPLESCNLFAGFTDRDLGTINCTRKIAREWLIYEYWCTNGVPDRITQLIEITDTIAPIIEPIADITVSASKGNCMANVQLPELLFSDECNGIYTFNITYPGGFVVNQTTALVLLPSGSNEITYTVYDACLNSATTSFIVYVEDNTAPTVICKGEVVVSLNFLGEAYIRPVHINDGSFDACGISHYAVRRMTDSCGSGTDVFGSLVDFCCADVGDTVIVEMRVTDINNNSNTCMVPITVQDKFAPQITCPADVTITCDTPIDLTDLTEYGEAVAIDACGATVIELLPISGVNQCRVGVIERIFVASDNLGSDSCSQFITMINEDPFSFDDIEQPLDYETDKGCTPLELHPDNLPYPYGRPVITEDFCDNVGSTFEDQVFNFVPGACFKIVRTWYVIDWCAMQNNPDYQPYSFQQTIKVLNTIGPVISEASCAAVPAVCTPKNNCERGYVTLEATATDVCTPGNLLYWNWKVDLDNDGIYEDEDSGFGDHIIASDSFPIGNHRIQYSFEDRCGNVTTCDKFFSVVNCDLPQAVCIESISIGLVPMDLDGDGISEVEMSCITPHSLDVSSFHPCMNDLCFSFSPDDLTDTIACYDCFQLGINEVTLYVIDKIGGGIAECVVEVDVQDNNDVHICPDLEECIVWPDSVSETGCDLDISLTGFDKIPLLNTDCDCNDVTVTHINNPPSSCGPNCTTASRIWTVTFHCYAAPISFNYSQTITVIDDTPDAGIIGDNIICTGTSTTLTATGGGTYLWSNNATTTSIIVSPQTTTIYRVTVTSTLGCTDVAEITVTVNPLPAVTIQGNTIICIGENTTLTATGGTSFEWSNGQSTASIVVNPLVTTSYTVTVTDANGCIASASATVTVNALPIVNITGTSPICVGQSTTLIASGGTSYLWSTGQTTANITVSPPSTQSYTVTVTNINNCSSTGSFNVVVNPLPVVNVTGNNVICEGESTTLTATGGPAYLWSTGQTTASIIVSPNITTLYTVTVTNNNNCSATSSRTVTVNQRPDAIITGDTIICVDDTTTLTASGGGTYLWSTGQNTASIDVSPDQTTTYSVTVTNTDQCTDVASVSVEVGTGAVTCETVDTTVYLDIMGMVVITADLISVGDTSGCNGEILVEVDPGIFFCNQIGINEVTLRVINTATMDTLVCFADVTVVDSIPPTLTCPNDTIIGCLEYDPDAPLSVFGSAIYSDNCLVGLDLDSTTIPNLNVCFVGVITRTYVATDNSNNSTLCVQTITIEPTNAITEDNITWPQDTVTINTCVNSDPMFTGMPEVDDQGADCAIISIDYDDQLLPPGGGGCPDTIIRTWTVIDSCQLVPGTNDGIFTFVQVIFVIDTLAPVLSNLPPIFIDVMLGIASCDTFVDLSGIIATDCDTNLIVTNNGFWADNQNSLDPSGTYDAGIYPITVSAQDECGNVAEYSFILKISAFRALCTKQFLNIPDTCSIREPALSWYVFDNVCPQSGHFLGSYSMNVADSIMMLDCSDVSGVGVNVKIYLWDTRSGDTILWDTCRSQYFLTDSLNICQTCTGGRVVLNGIIETIINIPVGGADVNINNTSVKTNHQGVYRDENMYIGDQYTILPRKTTGVLEGVSTLDLILIQRHITGVGLLGNPYNLIASDINNDRKVNTIDLVELRKTILGITNEFPNNDSWRIIPKDFKFLDDGNPFASPIPNSYFVEAMPGNMKVDFTGIKVGDVNNSYQVQTHGTETRTGDDLILQITDQRVQVAGTSVVIPVRTMTDQHLSGFQFALNIQELYNVQVVSDVIQFGKEHYHVANGYMYISWSDKTPVQISAGEVLFSIHAGVKEAGYMHELVILEEGALIPESYNENFKVNKVFLNYGHDAIQHHEFMIMGNAPNPWSQITTIQFYVPTTGNVDMVIRDITGKLLINKKGTFDKGVHAFEIHRNDLHNTGVFIYELKFNDTVKTGKMILIE